MTTTEYYLPNKVAEIQRCALILLIVFSLERVGERFTLVMILILPAAIRSLAAQAESDDNGRGFFDEF